MIRVCCWDPTARCVTHADALPASAAALPADAVVWVDLEDPTPEEEERVFREFKPVHPLTLEDVTRARREPDHGAHLPKVEEFPDYLFVVVNPLPCELCDPTEGKPPPRRWVRPQLSAVMTENVLVTHHYQKLSCIDDARKHVTRRAESAGRGPDYLFHLILDEMVDEYAPVVERFAEELDRLEYRLFRRPTRGVLIHLLRLKRTVVFLRKTLVLEREVLARLIRREFALVAEREVVYYRNVYDHLVRYTELVEGAREMVSDLMQTHLSAASHRLNEVMKVLTMISIIGSICTLIAGIYGMNFKHMPELEWEYGYPMAVGFMVVAAIGCLAAYRWKGWI